jgi:hypothetical protein
MRRSCQEKRHRRKLIAGRRLRGLRHQAGERQSRRMSQRRRAVVSFGRHHVSFFRVKQRRDVVIVMLSTAKQDCVDCRSLMIFRSRFFSNDLHGSSVERRWGHWPLALFFRTNEFSHRPPTPFKDCRLWVSFCSSVVKTRGRCYNGTNFVHRA